MFKFIPIKLKKGVDFFVVEGKALMPVDLSILDGG